MNGITLKENQSLFFQAEDKDGHILATNSISIFKIGQLIPDNFTVDFDFDKVTPKVTFMPKLKNNASIYNDIYYKLSNADNIISVEDGGQAPTEWKQINNNSNNTLFTLLDNVNFTIFFEIRSKVDNSVVLTKSFDINLRANGVAAAGMGNIGNDESGITGGTVNGEDDPSVVTGGNSLFGGYSDSDGFNLNMSFDDIINMAKGSFNTFKMIFSILPSFIWILVALGISISIILRIVGR